MGRFKVPRLCRHVTFVSWQTGSASEHPFISLVHCSVSCFTGGPTTQALGLQAAGRLAVTAGAGIRRAQVVLEVFLPAIEGPLWGGCMVPRGPGHYAIHL